MIKLRIEDFKASGTFLLPEQLGDATIVSGGLYVLKPGETAHPEKRHAHATNEVFIFVQATGVLPIDGVDYPIATGDVFIVEKGEDHHTRSSVESPLVAAWYVIDY